MLQDLQYHVLERGPMLGMLLHLYAGSLSQERIPEPFLPGSLGASSSYLPALCTAICGHWRERPRGHVSKAILLEPVESQEE